MKIAFLGNLPPASVFPAEALTAPASSGDHPAPWMVALLPALKQLTGFHLRVILCHKTIQKRVLIEKDGIEYEGIPDVFPARLARKTLHFKTSLLTTPAIRRFRPDLVHAFGFETGNALIALRSGFPVSCFIQGIAQLLYPFCGHMGWCDQKIMVWAERYAAEKIRWMVAENNFAKNWALSVNPAATVSVIPHPTRQVFFEKSAPRFPPVILTVGGLDDRKGMDTVIRAFAISGVASAKLVVVGAGPLRRQLESLARLLRVSEHIRFTGPLGTEEVIACMNEARAFVLASRMDTSPNVISEAHAIGIPVIGTRVGGIPEMVEDGLDGFWADKDDIFEISMHMRTLLEDENLARKMGGNGKMKVMKLNNSLSVAEAHAEYFQNIRQCLGV